MTQKNQHSEGTPGVRARRGVSLRFAIVTIFLVAVVSFILGARGSDLMASLAVNQQNRSLPAQLDYSQLDEVYDALKGNYDGKLDAQTLLNGAKKGLVEATGDPYTEFFTDQEASEFFGELDGRFSGIGAELGKRDGQLTIMSTIDGAPAQKAGLRSGDIIGRVNEEDTLKWSVEEAVSKIRGEKGTTVKLTILRNNEVMEFSIVRDDVVDPSVRSEKLAGDIGYIRLSRFNDTDTTRLMRQAAERFKTENVKGIILDLRGNGGGYVQAAQEVAGIWLDSSKTVTEERRGGKVLEDLKAKGQPILNGVPTVVLVDGGSASASEIIAGAFKDYGVAKLVGQKTYGKGSVQKVDDEIISGGQLKVTIAKWYTPKGKNFDKEGITPDETMEITEEDIEADRDPQRARAVELLKR